MSSRKTKTTGTVKWYNSRKGFGFIVVGGDDVFIHHSDIVAPGFRTLKDGEKVEFDMVSAGPQKKKAINCMSVARKHSFDAVDVTDGKILGSVKWYNCSKGFGFVCGTEEGEDYFVHQSEIQHSGFRSLKIGELVEFFAEQEMGRWKAIKVCAPGGGDVEGAPHPSVRRGRFYHDDEYDVAQAA